MNNFAYIVGILLIAWFFSFVYGQYKTAKKLQKLEKRKRKSKNSHDK